MKSNLHHYKHYGLVLLIIAFFFSGASALVYQVLWVKQLTLTFGSTTLAVSTILACFMAGLAFGSYLMGTKITTIKRVLIIYALLEICIGVYALFLPLLFETTDYLYKLVWPYTNDIHLLLPIIRFFLVFIVLIIPTTLMGATLPLLVKYYINTDDLIVKYVSFLYGINTLGAVFGALLCGFVLLETLGITFTNYIAIGFNFIAAIISIIIEKKDQLSNPKNLINEDIILTKYNYNLKNKLILIIMLLSGFTAMMYEIIWSRLLVLIFGSTTYAYTAMLAVFLMGISLGSIYVNKYFKNNTKNLIYFAILQLLIGGFVILGTYYFKYLFYIFLKVMETVNLSYSSLIFNILYVSGLLILPAALIFGALFPLSVKLFDPEQLSISQRTAKIYTFNTIGCIIGSFSAGFVLIPVIGLRWSLVFAACINVLLALIFVYNVLQSHKVRTVIIFVCCLFLCIFIIKPGKWNNQFITLGNYVNKLQLILNESDIKDERALVFYKEGQHSIISVREVGINTKNRMIEYALYNNGKVDATNRFADIRTQTAISYIPALVSSKLDDILIIGMGSGMTASVIELFPAKNIELVELERSVLEARKFFSDRYGDPLEDKRLKIIIDDARNYLGVTPKTYDVIISEPSNVWISGVASLFTREYYRTIKNKLKPKGVLCQWMHLYCLKPERVFSVLKTLKSEFQYVYVCHSKTTGDLIILASQEPVILDLKKIRKQLTNNVIKNDLKEIFNINNEYEFLNLFLSNNDNLTRVLNNLKPSPPINTDNNSYLEFGANKDFFTNIKRINSLSTLKLFNKFRGISKDNINEPYSEFYKDLSLNIVHQYERSIMELFEPEKYERLLYKSQVLVYTIKYKQESSNKQIDVQYLSEIFLINSHFYHILRELSKDKKITDDLNTQIEKELNKLIK